MSEVELRQWFQARLRWAVLEEGWGGTNGERRNISFSARIGRRRFSRHCGMGRAEERSLVPAPDQKPGPTIDCRFAQVVYLEELGVGRTAFDVYLGETPATEWISITSSIRRRRRRPPFFSRVFSVAPAYATP